MLQPRDGTCFCLLSGRCQCLSLCPSVINTVPQSLSKRLATTYCSVARPVHGVLVFQTQSSSQLFINQPCGLILVYVSHSVFIVPININGNNNLIFHFDFDFSLSFSSNLNFELRVSLSATGHSCLSSLAQCCSEAATGSHITCVQDHLAQQVHQAVEEISEGNRGNSSQSCQPH